MPSFAEIVLSTIESPKIPAARGGVRQLRREHGVEIDHHTTRATAISRGSNQLKTSVETTLWVSTSPQLAAKKIALSRNAAQSKKASIEDMGVFFVFLMTLRATLTGVGNRHRYWCYSHKYPRSGQNLCEMGGSIQMSLQCALTDIEPTRPRPTYLKASVDPIVARDYRAEFKLSPFICGMSRAKFFHSISSTVPFPSLSSVLMLRDFAPDCANSSSETRLSRLISTHENVMHSLLVCGIGSGASMLPPCAVPSVGSNSFGSRSVGSREGTTGTGNLGFPKSTFSESTGLMGFGAAGSGRAGFSGFSGAGCNGLIGRGVGVAGFAGVGCTDSPWASAGECSANANKQNAKMVASN